MSDVLKPVIDGNSIKNGSMVVHQTNSGATRTRDPDVNSFVPSGTMFTRLDTRFDDVRYYSGDTAN